MSQESGFPIILHSITSLSRNQVWVSALTQPSVATFEDFVQDPDATHKRAYNWMFVSAPIGYAISTLVNAVLMVFIAGAPEDPETFGMGLICGAPIAAYLSVLGLMINAGITQEIASALGGTGTYSKLAYAFAAYLAPLVLILSVLGLIPYLNLLSYPLAIYGIVLNVIAVKAVHQFSWGKAIASSASSVLILIGMLVLVACMVIVILALLGPG